MPGLPSTTRYAIAEEDASRYTSVSTINAQTITKHSFAQSVLSKIKSTDLTMSTKLKRSLRKESPNGKY